MAVAKVCVALRCSLGGSKDDASWRWEVLQRDYLASNHETASGSLTAHGVGFSMFASPARELLCAGAARHVEYEALRLRRRKRSRAHAGHEQIKALPSGARDIAALARNRTSEFMVQPVFSPRILGRVAQVSCGVSHCIALVVAAPPNGSSDSIFAWGIGIYGQLGLGEQQRADTMAPVYTTAELQAQIQSTGAASLAEVRCGPFGSCVFFKNTSNVWHWGLLPSRDDSGTSVDEFVLQGVPAPFPMIGDGVELLDVAVGLEHMVLLSASGQVYSWGYGHHGQLGLGQDRVVVVNQHAEQVAFFHPSRVTITAISCGWHHTLALTRDNAVYAWGSNRLGACGAATKFHEYFTPVSVALPVHRPRGDGSDAVGKSCSVSCCGDTSVLTVRHRNTGALVSAFAWGVCSGAVSALTPVEVVGVQWHTRLTDCRAGLGGVLWCYEADSENVNPPLLQIQPDTLPSGQALHVGDVLVLQLCRISGDECADDECLVQDKIAVRQLTSSFVEDGTTESSGQILQLVRIEPSSADSTSELDVVLQAVMAGEVEILLSYAGDPVLGSPFQVRAWPPEQDSGRRASTDGCNYAIVRAMSVVSNLLDRTSQTVADLRWLPPAVNRVRVRANDILALLIESTWFTSERSIRVQSLFGNSTGVDVCTLGVVADTRQSRRLVCATFRISQLGAFALVLTPSRLALGHSVKLLEVVCVMDPVAKSRLLESNTMFIERQLDRAIGSSASSDTTGGCGRASSTRARFSVFISTLLQKTSLRDALVNTPLASTADVESALDWDFDCEEESRLLVCSRQEDPFALWRTTLYPVSKPLSLNGSHGGGHRRFWDAVPRWVVDNPATIELSLAVVCAQEASAGGVSDTSSDSNEAIAAGAIAKLRDEERQVGVRVHQSPHEFLVSSTADIGVVNSPLRGDSSGDHSLVVTAWRDQHGELFYTAQPPHTRKYAVVPYGHESHSFRESAAGNLVGQRKTQLHSFLWEVLSTRQCDGVAGLFRLFLSGATPTGSSGASDAETHIRIRDFASTLERLGFPSAQVSKQEWLALFAEIQRLAPRDGNERVSSAKVTRCVFKTFVIDPHHLLFWRSYTNTLRARSSDAVVDVQALLLKHFRPAMRGDDPESHTRTLWSVPWSEFCECLEQFHQAVGLRRGARGMDTVEEACTPPPLVSASDCCRLLYRFDVRCDGQIAVRLFIERVVYSLHERERSADASASVRSRKSKATLACAVRSAKRPDVDTFSTPSALQKLFVARANPRREDAATTSPPAAASARRSLVVAGNTHLARIRSLPVSTLLREGVAFRPQFHTAASASEPDAAEQSY